MSRTLVAIAAAACIAATAAPASAQIAGGYNDRQRYDFALNPSEANFEARLRLAARQYCGQHIGTVTLREFMMVRQCKRDFIDRAHRGIDPTSNSD